MEGFAALFGDFALDALERVERVEQWLLDLGALDGDPSEERLLDVKRELHTLKGNAGMMGLAALQQLAHDMEDRLLGSTDEGALDIGGLLASLDAFRTQTKALLRQDGPAPSGGAPVAADADSGETGHASVRVPFAALDQLIDVLAEMVILRNRLTDTVGAFGRLDEGVANGRREVWDDVEQAHGALCRTLDVVQDHVMALRLTPLKTVFGSLRRIVHDEATRHEKTAQLETAGGDTPLDKALLDLANEALGHLVRNALVHGLESPGAREAAGKPRCGTVWVSAAARGDEVRIEVADDGGGIDRDQLRQAAAARGFTFGPDEDVFPVLFEAGFTTRLHADMSAGRGLGLAAVRDAVRRQGGDIEVSSTVGAGTTFRLRLPMSVSIARALLLRADDELYALPLTSVVESRRLRPGDCHRVNRAGVLRWRNEVISLLDLGTHFGTGTAARDGGYVVVVGAGGKRRGLVADAIHGLQEVVVKGLDPIVGRPTGIAGSTVLGDGRPILILDPRALVDVEPFTTEQG
ncbi:MAG TPA: chemotaxis protein CheW [Gemmatimonadales bacterium]